MGPLHLVPVPAKMRRASAISFGVLVRTSLTKSHMLQDRVLFAEPCRSITFLNHFALMREKLLVYLFHFGPLFERHYGLRWAAAPVVNTPYLQNRLGSARGLLLMQPPRRRPWAPRLLLATTCILARWFMTACLVQKGAALCYTKQCS